MIHCVIPDDYQYATREFNFLNSNAQIQTQSLGDLTTDPETDEALASADVLLLIRERTLIDEAFLERTPKLRLISQTGKISRNIDLDACAKRGISVVDGFGDPIAPAEWAWLLIMAARRQFVAAVNGMAQGQWQTNIGRSMASQTLGILGFGKTGKQMLRYATAFDMKVQIWGSERAQDEARSLGLSVPDSREQFFASSDIVTVHQRLVPETDQNIRFEDLSAMHADAVFCNTSRAELVEEDALVRALNLGKPGWAAIDVYEQEPIYDILHPLLKLPNVLCSPHMGYVETNSYNLYLQTAFNNIVTFFDLTAKPDN
ncbi:MAG: D-2-hydroxyacid dehydrogenase family protein [Reinekea forsetii]|nr:D-2-hydroxyacid dehydrogenase family protein [Reinekea forsetii]MDO7643427.1 D-2-hydroxyacid dehydrogenase family protein [Reinekea forsetii]